MENHKNIVIVGDANIDLLEEGWFTQEVKELIKERDKKNVMTRRYPNTHRFEVQFADLQRRVKNVIEYNKKEHFESELKDYERSMKKTCDTAKEMTEQCGERNHCNILMNDGKKINQPEKIVNLLNEVAEKLIKKRNTHHINNNIGKPNVSLYIAKTNEEDIHEVENNFKANTSSGIDGIKPKLIKDMTIK
ncbi:hypothetical protein HHI36_022212 [Cryptolaemus montrouzieri]|uniref:Uncharacterized protein n=1 Tax=Cryptolaemus montrouzieri TaxID=559131 RepID=A0ABD2MZJ2_9CUCU